MEIVRECIAKPSKKRFAKAKRAAVALSDLSEKKRTRDAAREALIEIVRTADLELAGSAMAYLVMVPLLGSDDKSLVPLMRERLAVNHSSAYAYLGGLLAVLGSEAYPEALQIARDPEQSPDMRASAVEYLDEMNELGLVGATDNTISGSSVICMCCECCCSQIRGRTRWDNPDAMSPSNFIPVAGDDCVGCGTCTERCFFQALTVDEETERAVVVADECIGCGVCTLACPTDALKLQRLERSTPFPTGKDLVRAIAKENRE